MVNQKIRINHRIFELCRIKGDVWEMDDWVLRVAATLVKAREEAGVSQATLAQRMEVSRQSVIKWERGINAISFPMLMKWFVGCGVSLERYLDFCIHPGLLERLEDDPTDKEKRRMLHEAIEECSAYEVDALLYIRYGAHGSDHLSVLTEMVANLHTPLRDRVSIVNAILSHYEIATATKTDVDPEGLQPNIEMLCQARDCGMAAAKNMEDVYSINKEAVEDAKKKDETH